jgi:hypothetical protein
MSLATSVDENRRRSARFRLGVNTPLRYAADRVQSLQLGPIAPRSLPGIPLSDR